ncbi:cytochrome b subunit of succinate dehydrogenase, Sdh3p [Oleoguttula sp. CCFEE 5521]
MALAQRTAQQSLRRLAVQRPAFKFTTPAAVAFGNAFISQRRHAAATTVSALQAHDSILAKQRLNRPVAPHLGIYKPQITWYGSAFNRITGVALSGGMYLFGIGYLVAPALGWHLESSVIAASFAAWPVALKVFTKFAVAMPFVYHSLNGFRHLAWDTASLIENGMVQKTGWAVVGLSVVGALGLAVFV